MAAVRLEREGSTYLFLAIRDEDVSDYHYFFYSELAAVLARKMDAVLARKYSDLLREELEIEAHGEIDEKSWRLKERLLRKPLNPKGSSKALESYFRQSLDSNGWQQESYLNADTELLPIEQVIGPDGKPLMIAVETTTGVLHARIWRAEVGRTLLLLLDANVPENTEEDRTLTARLYGGDARTRIRQELLLGVGGLRALHALGPRLRVVGDDLLVPREALHREQRGPGERLADLTLEVVHVGVADLFARQQRGDALARVAQRPQQRA